MSSAPLELPFPTVIIWMGTGLTADREARTRTPTGLQQGMQELCAW